MTLRGRASPAVRVIHALPLLLICHTLSAGASLKDFDLARVARGKTRDCIADGVGNPNPVLLVNRQMEWTVQLARAVFARSAGGSFSDQDLSLARVAFRAYIQPCIKEVERPDIAIWCNDDALHDAELPPKLYPSGGDSGLPVLSNSEIAWPAVLVIHMRSLASIAGSKISGPIRPPPVNPVVIGDRGCRVEKTGKLRHVSVPQRTVPLASDKEIGAASMHCPRCQTSLWHRRRNHHPRT